MHKPIVLCIMDGWGLRDVSNGNAPFLAETKTLDYLFKNYPNNKLNASGLDVGLPDGQMGNSEVGHMNIGAGRIVYTGLSLINKMISDDTLKSKPEFKKIFDILKNKKSNLHLMSLASFGGVHAHLDHYFYIAKVCKELNIPYFVHLFTDGRDVSPNQAKTDFKSVVDVVKSTNGTIGVISGRYFAMDRDKNFERTKQVYDYLIGEEYSNTFEDPVKYIEKSYSEGITDEFIKPSINKNALNSTIKDDDVVIFLNFRPDRARQISHMIVGSKNVYEFDNHKKLNNIDLFGMMEYNAINLSGTIFPPFEIKNTLGEVLEKNSISQLRIAETEKYPHVTWFFDGAQEAKYSKLKKILIPSPKVATYDLKPEMSAVEITDNLLNELENIDVVILNFANPDMVGHTGSLEATIKACETVDKQIGRIYEKLKDLSGTLIVIADHGNADIMIADDGNPHTAHTTNQVPIIICKKDIKIKSGGKLGDVAPTILSLLNVSKPEEMNGNSLIF